MKVKRTLKMIVGCLLITNLCWAGITQEGDTLPPGVVIHNAPAISHEYIGSPSIVIMPDGTYIASHDYFGKKLSDTYIYRSGDRGNSWTPIAKLESLTWATLFNRGKEFVGHWTLGAPGQNLKMKSPGLSDVAFITVLRSR